MKNERNIESDTIKDCPLFYNMIDRPCTETCMCWGWDFSEGWNDIISNMSREIEVWNNMFYPKYRVRIQADQIKEKFGEIRVYYSVVVDHNKIITFITNKMYCILSFFDNHKRFDYKMKRVVDVEPYEYDETEELSKEEYDNEMNRKYKISNVEIKEENGKYLRITHLENYGKWHMEPTRHKIAWKIRNIVSNLIYKINWFPKKNNRHIMNIVAFLEERAEEIVKKTEEKCSKTCEFCGTHIGTSYSPSCQTTGWIRYLCDECAEKSNSEYYKNGALYKGKDIIQTKEEVDKERKDFENKYRSDL